MTKQEKINELLYMFDHQFVFGPWNCYICSEKIKDEECYVVGCWDCGEIYICEKCFKDLKGEE